MPVTKVDLIHLNLNIAGLTKYDFGFEGIGFLTAQHRCLDTLRILPVKAVFLSHLN